MAVPPTLEDNIGCLTRRCEDHYRLVAPINTEEGRQAVVDGVKQHYKQSNPNGAMPDEQLLAKLSESQTVDIIQLLPALKQTNFMGVNMYVDDKGTSKGSPHNERASQVCTACGLPTDVRGDAFLARVWDDQDGFVRHNLVISEISSGFRRGWRRRQSTPSARPSRGRELSAMKSGSAAEPADTRSLAERLDLAKAAKAAGTEQFKAGDVGGAAERYAEAVKLLGDPRQSAGAGVGAAAAASDGRVDARVVEVPTERRCAATGLLVTTLINLATCRLKQEKPYEAIAACDQAVDLDEGAGKAWYRRGQACLALQQYAAARKNLGRAANLMPSSREVRDEYARCQALAAENKASGFGLGGL